MLSAAVWHKGVIATAPSDGDSAMITLHQYTDCNGLPSMSPFCAKLEAWLKLTGTPYQEAPMYGPQGAPKGQAPYVTLPDGSTLGDSGLIIHHLVSRGTPDPDAGLTAAQRALGRALTALCEERLYYALLRFRWQEEAGFAVLKNLYFNDIPEPERSRIAGGFRAQTVAKLQAHGYGRHTAAEVAALAAADIQALATLLGAGPWLSGDRPTTADCAVWAMLWNLAHPAFDTPMRAALWGRGGLMAYVDRGVRTWFPAAAMAEVVWG